jgi:hypothetical protein
VSTKQDVIDAIAEVAVAQAALDAAIANVRDAHSALVNGGPVGNVTVIAGGITSAGLATTMSTLVTSLNGLSDAVAAKVVAADAVADALT